MDMEAELIAYFEQFLTPERRAAIDRVLDQRSRYITVVLEDIFQPQNASAVLRSADCFGVQQVHIVENRYDYRINPDVVMGATQWIEVQRHNAAPYNTQAAIDLLRGQGYRIVATSPHQSDTTPDSFDLAPGPIALFFGTERKGLTDTVLQQADEFVRIPMLGFTESLNISVSAAILLQRLAQRLRQSALPWQLAPDDRQRIKLQWLRQNVKLADKLERQFWKQHAQG